MKFNRSLLSGLIVITILGVILVLLAKNVKSVEALFHKTSFQWTCAVGGFILAQSCVTRWFCRISDYLLRLLWGLGEWGILLLIALLVAKHGGGSPVASNPEGMKVLMGFWWGIGVAGSITLIVWVGWWMKEFFVFVREVGVCFKEGGEDEEEEKEVG